MNLTKLSEEIFKKLNVSVYTNLDYHIQLDEHLSDLNKRKKVLEREFNIAKNEINRKYTNQMAKINGKVNQIKFLNLDDIYLRTYVKSLDKIKQKEYKEFITKLTIENYYEVSSLDLALTFNEIDQIDITNNPDLIKEDLEDLLTLLGVDFSIRFKIGATHILSFRHVVQILDFDLEGFIKNGVVESRDELNELKNITGLISYTDEELRRLLIWMMISLLYEKDIDIIYDNIIDNDYFMNFEHLD